MRAKPFSHVKKRSNTFGFLLFFIFFSNFGSQVAAAQTVFDFTWNDGAPFGSQTGASINAQFTTNDLGGGNYEIIGISPTSTFTYGGSSYAMTLLNPSVLGTANVLYYPPQPGFTYFSSIGFTANGADWNFFNSYNVPGDISNYTLAGADVFSGNNITLNEVPEIDGATLPKALLLLGSVYLVILRGRNGAGGVAADGRQSH